MPLRWQDSINSLIELSLNNCNSSTVAVLRKDLSILEDTQRKTLTAESNLKNYRKDFSEGAGEITCVFLNF